MDENLETRIKDIEIRLTKLETKLDYVWTCIQTIKDNEQRHVWALILMLAGTLIPLVLKVLNII